MRRPGSAIYSSPSRKKLRATRVLTGYAGAGEPSGNGGQLGSLGRAWVHVGNPAGLLPAARLQELWVCSAGSHSEHRAPRAGPLPKPGLAGHILLLLLTQPGSKEEARSSSQSLASHPAGLQQSPRQRAAAACEEGRQGALPVQRRGLQRDPEPPRAKSGKTSCILRNSNYLRDGVKAARWYQTPRPRRRN